MFIIPILLVAAISISHVVSWYDMANPISWAIYLSIAVEIAAMTALSAASVKVKGFSIWMVFGIVTFIQFMGNIFFSYKEINLNDVNFKSWVELVSPIFDMMGLDSSDPITHKRWLALLTGGLLPLISLTCLHFFIKYGGADDVESKKEVINEIDKDTQIKQNKEEGINDALVRLSKIKEEINTNKETEVSISPIEETLVSDEFKEEELILYEETGDESEGIYFEPETIENITENPSEEEDEKKNSTTDDNTPGGFTDQGSTNNSKIQMGQTKRGENIIYKLRGPK
jgi:hypothetical protein